MFGKNGLLKFQWIGGLNMFPDIFLGIVDTKDWLELLIINCQFYCHLAWKWVKITDQTVFVSNGPWI